MTKIMNPRPGTVVGPAQTNLPGEIVKGSVHCRYLQAAAMIVDEKARRRRIGHPSITTLGVSGQHIPGGIMDRNQTGFVELRPTDGEEALVKIYILPF
jgi:hypothetical protein